MSVDVETPGQVYKKISQEVERILEKLTESTTDSTLQQANNNARLQLENFQLRLDEAIKSLSKNAEWDTFTIAFYGETNAGKSTVIETLRILLKEESKKVRQEAFRQFQQQHDLSPAALENADRALRESEEKYSSLIEAIDTVRERYHGREKDLEQQLLSLNILIEHQQKRWSTIRKVLALFIKSHEQKELAKVQKLQQALNAEITQDTQDLESKKAECESYHHSLMARRTQREEQFTELANLADGEIIGTGLSDFTMDATLYPFKVNQQQFALLDVPGIEGKESKVLGQIQQAVEKAHAVFYVTSKATAPQKGDEHNPGTLEKIKSHLNAQTEVWTLFNKRVTNPMQLSRPLISDDEKFSLQDLNEKMHEQLGDNYRNTLTISAMPAFLSVAEHLVPGGKNAKNRAKLLETFDTEQVLAKTGMTELAKVLTQQLVADSKAKIAHSNINKTRLVLDDIASQVGSLQQNTYAKLVKQLRDDTDNAHQLLDLALASLRTRLLNKADEAVDGFRSKARKQVYREIENDISNDRFKSELEIAIREQHTVLEKALPEFLKSELDRFQSEIGDVVERFQQHAREILDTYSRLQKHQFNNEFPLEINIDNGIKVTGLLATLAGGALLFWNPAGWLILAPALASLAFAAYKAVRSFFSSDYKISQQKQSADNNLNKVTENIKDMINEGIEKAFPELRDKVTQLKSMLEEPVRQVSTMNKILARATGELRLLSASLVIPGAK